MSDAYVPMPMTCHPFYDGKDEGVRALLDRRFIHVAEIQRLAPAQFLQPGTEGPVTSLPVRRRTLEVKKCAGPAPFVGDPDNPAMYLWNAAVDDAGRHIAGPAQLEWRFGHPW